MTTTAQGMVKKNPPPAGDECDLPSALHHERLSVTETCGEEQAADWWEYN